jgi:UDP-N-acetylglucosamine 3-dehydrogenase
MALKVAVVGVGHIGSFHLDAYRTCPDASIVAVCDLIRDKAEAAAKTCGATPYTSLAQMLDKEKLDAVSVCTAGAQNGSHHFAPVMQCLSKGVSVLCEKPLSNQLTEARAMVQKARSEGVYLGTDLNHRFTPQAELAKQWIQDGKLGTVLLANVTLWIDNPTDRSPWYHLRALHPHSLDVMRYFCGKATKVHAFFNRAPKADSPDGKRVCWSNVQMNVLFENGAVGHLTGSYDANPRLNLERAEIMGTEGRFVIDNCYEKMTWYPRHSAELTIIPNPLFGGVPNFDNTITRRVHHWVKDLLAGTPADKIEASGADGLAVQEIIEAAIRSWENDMVMPVENG